MFGNDLGLIIGNKKNSRNDIHRFTRKERNKKERSIRDYYLIHKGIWKYAKDIKVKRNAGIESGPISDQMIYNVMQEK